MRSGRRHLRVHYGLLVMHHGILVVDLLLVMMHWHIVPEPHLDVGRSGRVVCVPSLVRDCSRRKVLDPWSGYALIVSCPWPMYKY